MKLELSKELLEEIDFVLKKASLNGTIEISFNRNNLSKKALQYCLSLNLFRVKSNNQFQLNEKGVFAIQDGGIKIYLKNIRTEKDLENTIKVLTSRNLKYQFLHSVILVVLGFLLSFVPKVLNEDKNSTAIELLNKQYIEIKNINEYFQKNHSDMNTLILELKTEIDSLKNE